MRHWPGLECWLGAGGVTAREMPPIPPPTRTSLTTTARLAQPGHSSTPGDLECTRGGGANILHHHLFAYDISSRAGSRQPSVARRPLSDLRTGDWRLGLDTSTTDTPRPCPARFSETAFPKCRPRHTPAPCLSLDRFAPGARRSPCRPEAGRCPCLRATSSA